MHTCVCVCVSGPCGYTYIWERYHLLHKGAQLQCFLLLNGTCIYFAKGWISIVELWRVCVHLMNIHHTAISYHIKEAW